MNLAINLTDFDSHYVTFLNPYKNNYDKSNFYKIIYSNELITFHGVCLFVKFYAIDIEDHYNKHKIKFNCENENNQSSVATISQIEECILKKFCKIHYSSGANDKHVQYKLSHQLTSGFFKLLRNDPAKKCSELSIVIKISGVWESDTEYGLIYKFEEGNVVY
jgi:hypothetical protein